jgi:hypothetical protein
VSLKGKSIKQISHLELNDLSLHKFLNDIRLPQTLKFEDDGAYYPIMLSELQRFGILNIGDLEKLIRPDFFKEYTNLLINKTLKNYQLIRAAMLVSDLQKSLEILPTPHELGPGIFQMLSKAYDKEILDKAVAEKAIKIVQ